jgi:L-alanine-DL-glutamate epimerase-like enolase superfamily enzyme
MLPVLTEFGVTVLEQPLEPGDLDGLGLVTSQARIPVIADESCLVAADIPALVGRVDGINIKLAKTGGLREALRMISVARAHHLMVMVGCMIESSIGITAAAQFCPLVDICDLDGAALLAHDPYVGATIERGRLRLPEGPGLGLSVR